MKPESVIVDVAIPRDDWLRVYEGSAHRVYVVARDGRSVVFPARILQRWMDHDGVYGTFVISYNSEGRFDSVRKIADLPKSTPTTQVE
ncbi:DUF2835 family protein [Salicola sp. Rm-C-2C1-2]|uniref:DUF2835 family protein n=1 Tax=Salicola sp. Rm-C-2C1-2 TaxID=3141321 RepID=UPI0032E44B71